MRSNAANLYKVYMQSVHALSEVNPNRYGNGWHCSQ